VQFYTSTTWAEQTSDAPKQGAFAGAIWTKDANNLATRNSKLKLIQYLSATIALRKARQRQLNSHQIHVTRAEPFQPTSEGMIEP
jgi:hypothetical protein